MTVSPLGLASFDNLRALSTKRNESPQQASRPFDKDRDGFVMSEGGVIFVLESEQSARSRGAKGYAELAGFGASSDAFHLVIPSSDPEPMANAMSQALADAGISPGGNRLRQRPCYQHAGGRCRRVAGDSPGAGRCRVRSAGQLDQGHVRAI